MVVLDYVRSALDYIRPAYCCSCDLTDFVTPERLRMVFIASTIVSIAAGLFAGYLSGTFAALPFLCAASASYLCTYLVERYFVYSQVLESHGRVVRELTEALRAAEQAIARGEQQVVHRAQQNSDLQREVQRLESALPAVSADTDTFIANLQQETREQKAQLVELRAHLGQLTEQNRCYEQTRKGFEENLARAEDVNKALSQENGEIRRLLEQQRRVNEESAHVSMGALAVVATTHQLGQQAANTVERIQAAAQGTVNLQKEAEERGKRLLELRGTMQNLQTESHRRG